jgi:PPP family 3-phenylpropionic acid transporter
VIRWRAAGVSPQTISVLWSLSVAAEVVVFFVLGPWLLRRLTPAGAVALAATAGAARWLVAAFTTDIVALSLIQPLHGVTFALLHLACMRLLAQSVPDALAATAQAIYGTVRVGAATALLTACFRMALCPPGSGGLWHHECAVPRGLADRALIETGARGHIPLTRPSSG